MTTYLNRTDSALDALVAELGPDSVTRATGEFGDPYRSAATHLPAGAVFPTSTEQVQAVLRIAREAGVPLWTHSMGRNFGYGGSEAPLPGSIVLSLRQMNRILDIDDVLGVAVIEPGVTFFALHEALRAGGHHLSMSVPDLGWGSVLGNALDHGVGYTGHGDHTDFLCGLEVVLPSGDVVRTGTGGMSGTPNFHVHRRGFGPSLDGLFTQSNLGVVTRAGVWLQPEPEAIAVAQVTARREADLGPLVEALRPLTLDGTINGYPMIRHGFGTVAALVPRENWPTISGPGTEAELVPFLDHIGTTIWNVQFALSGRSAVVAAQRGAVEQAMRSVPGAEVEFVEHEPPYTVETLPPTSLVPAGVPNMGLMSLLGPWGGHEGTGGHVDLSPVSPATGSDATAVFETVHGRLRRDGIPSVSAVRVGKRSLVHVNMLMFDRTDTAAVATTTAAYRDLIGSLGQQGYGLYRTHIDHADAVADRYDFGDHSLHRTLATIKDALDPDGVLSPGKQGVWPSAHPRPEDI